MLINSSDLLGTSAIQARKAAQLMDEAREQKTPDTVAILDEGIELLMQSLAELCVARFGVKRFNPAFDETESDGRIEALKAHLDLALRSIER